jgi:hypothetical protein
MKKNYPNLDEKTNQKNWEELVNYSKQSFVEMVEIMSQAITKVSEKIKNTVYLDESEKDKAGVLLAAAEFDLELAKGALADDNGPAVERAISRIEASLIEADPEIGIGRKDDHDDEIEEHKIVISEITEEINPLISNLETINEIDSVIPDEEIPLVDLTGISEQE